MLHEDPNTNQDMIPAYAANQCRYEILPMNLFLFKDVPLGSHAHISRILNMANFGVKSAHRKSSLLINRVFDCVATIRENEDITAPLP
jgi:hypothetical protein